jgi:hypothetical protein
MVSFEPVGESCLREIAPVTGTYLFQDEFDGPADAAPDPTKWTVVNWDEPVQPPILGHYRDDRRNVFLDGNSNLVIRATQEGGDYYSGRIQSPLKVGIGHTWEARVPHLRLLARVLVVESGASS